MTKKTRRPATKTPARVKPAPIYDRIREILESARTTVARSVNTTQVVANWLIGREIVEEEQRGRARAGYGEQLTASLSARLSDEFGRGYSVDNLEMFRNFYLRYPVLLGSENSDALRRELAPPSVPPQKSDALRRISGETSELPEIAHAARGQLTRLGNADIRYAALSEPWLPGQLHPNLSWTHYRTLLRVESVDARAFYEIESLQNNWSARELERQINSLLYQRLAKSRDKKGLMRLATKGHEIQHPLDIFKDPVVIEFVGLPESPKLVESDLETALLNNLQAFLLELGKGFAFISRQERITLDGDHFYIDLVFYHVILKCYVVIDLKVGKLTHADLGQLQLYVNYFDEERRTTGDNPTIGLILCTDKNDAVVKYTLGPQREPQIFASRYQLHLPTEDELCKEVRRELRELTSATPATVESPRKARKAKTRQPKDRR